MLSLVYATYSRKQAVVNGNEIQSLQYAVGIQSSHWVN